MCMLLLIRANVLRFEKKWKFRRRKAGCPEKAPVIFFQLSFSQSNYPYNFKIDRVSPILNNGEVKDLGNYRPISGFPYFSKILERII